MNEKTAPRPAWKVLRSKRASPTELRAHFSEHQVPVEIDKIMRGLGVETTESAGGRHAGSLELSEARAAFHVSLDEGPDARRFALACLIGHLMLDPPGSYTIAFAREAKAPDPRAAKYAHELLMPPPLIVEALREGVLPEELAQRFRVQPLLLEKWLSEMGLGGADRREHERVPARVQVRFIESGQAARALRAYSLNLSVGGLCIKTNRSYTIGDPLTLEMTIEDQAYTFAAEIAWVRAGAVGVRFTKVTEDERRRLETLVASLRK